MRTRGITIGDWLTRRERVSRQGAIKALAWMWSAIFSISLLSFIAVGSAWPGQILLFTGVLATMAVLRQAKARRPKRAPVPHLSGASKCVWQMDREA